MVPQVEPVHRPVLHSHPVGAVRRAHRLCHTAAVAPRFLTLADVAEVLNISAAQAYALVRSGDLEAVKVGGRGVWRVEATRLEAYIARLYDETREFVESHPFARGEEPPAEDDRP